MAKVLGQDIGKEFCEALGVSSKNVKSIGLVIMVDTVVSVSITTYVEDIELNKIQKLLSKYELHLKKDESGKEK